MTKSIRSVLQKPFDTLPEELRLDWMSYGLSIIFFGEVRQAVSQRLVISSLLLATSVSFEADVIASMQADAIYNHIEVENSDEGINAHSNHGVGIQFETGLSFSSDR